MTCGGPIGVRGKAEEEKRVDGDCESEGDMRLVAYGERVRGAWLGERLEALWRAGETGAEACVEGGESDCEERETDKERDEGESEVEPLWVLGGEPGRFAMRRLCREWVVSTI